MTQSLPDRVASFIAANPGKYATFFDATVAMLQEQSSAAGKLGGIAKTPAKQSASRTNGKLGGRPRKAKVYKFCSACGLADLEVFNETANGNRSFCPRCDSMQLMSTKVAT